MFNFDKKIICVILFIFIISFVSPILASEDALFVWYDNNSPSAIQTVASINQDKGNFNVYKLENEDWFFYISITGEKSGTNIASVPLA